MIAITTNSTSKLGAKFLYRSFMIVCFAIVLAALADYIPWSSVNFILGVIGLPVAISCSPTLPVSSRFYWLAVPLLLLSFLVPEKNILLVVVAAAVISIAESTKGKLAPITLLIICLMSPAIQYAAVVFSFPARLWLTDIAGQLLNRTGSMASTAGNVITFRGNEYSVDPACMGLKMLLTSLISGLLVLAVLQKKQNKTLRWPWAVSSLLAVFSLNLFANIIRIVVLVYFNIAPGNQMHGITGLACLAVYVLAPTVFVIGHLVKRFGRDTDYLAATAPSAARSPMHMFINTGMAVLLALSALQVISGSKAHGHGALPDIAGYSASWADKDVMQYRSGKALVYIKKIAGPLSGEHNPAICWLGCGYVFESIDETTVAGTQVHTGTMGKGNAKLYTAWWYDNGTNRTIGQGWRWNVIKGAKQYSVINVTASDKTSLYAEIVEITGKNIFRDALK